MYSDEVFYREGKTMIILYSEFNLTNDDGEKIVIKDIIIGPTQYPYLSLRSTGNFLDTIGIEGNYSIHSSSIPYRLV